MRQGRARARGHLAPPPRWTWGLLGVLLVLVALLSTSATVPAPEVGAPGAGAASPILAAPGPLWIWTFHPPSCTPFMPTYRALLEALPLDGRVLVAVANREAAVDFCRGLGRDAANDPRVAYVDVGSGVTPWSRDRLIATESHGTTRFLIPPRQRVRDVAQGELALADVLADVIPNGRVVESRGIVEGGDILLARKHAFVGAHTVRSVAGALDVRARPFLASLRSTFGRPPIVVHDGRGRVPHVHIDMFMTVVGDETVVLGDPHLSLHPWPEVSGRTLDFAVLDGLGTFSRRRQLEIALVYDGVAERFRALGYEVVRIPILHGEDRIGGAQPVILTWNNVLLDERPDRREVWIPHYGVPELEVRVRDTWERLGFAVHEVPAREPILMGGALRCLTNVVPVSLPGTLEDPFLASPCETP